MALLSGAEALPETLDLDAEIRTFNAGIDFRLRFLHVEIEPVFAAAPEVAAHLRERDERATVQEILGHDPLLAAASLALLLWRERPALLVVVGAGDLLPAAEAAARAAGTKLGYFGALRGSSEGALDLGESAAGALDRLTGVAREIH